MAMRGGLHGLGVWRKRHSSVDPAFASPPCSKGRPPPLLKAAGVASRGLPTAGTEA